jgi:hypothetical protein
MAAKLKLVIEQGATFRKVLTWKAGTPAVPVDISGYRGRMQVRESIDSDVVLLDLTTENGGLIFGGVDGQMTIYIQASVTASIDWESAVYDYFVIIPATPEPDVRKMLFGPITSKPEVTRA